MSTGNLGTLLFGVLLTAALLASYNMPDGFFPGRRERPRLYWTVLGIGVASIVVGGINLIAFGGGSVSEGRSRSLAQLIGAA